MTRWVGGKVMRTTERGRERAVMDRLGDIVDIKSISLINKNVESTNIGDGKGSRGTMDEHTMGEHTQYRSQETWRRSPLPPPLPSPPPK